jgi:HEAT repeat protein
VGCALAASAFDWPGRSARLLAELAQEEAPETRLDLIRLLGTRPEADAEAALLELAQSSAEARGSVREHAPLGGRPGERAALERREAVRGLCGRTSEAVLEALARASTDSAAEVRREAAHCLAGRGTPRAGTALIRLLGDPDPGVRATAARALGTVSEPNPAAPLAAALDDDSTEVRSSAVESLAQLELRAEASVLPALSAKLHDPAPEVRAAVLPWIARLAPARGELAISEALDDPNEDVRLSALRAAVLLPGALRGGLTARLTPLLASPDARLAAGAALALRGGSSAPEGPEAQVDARGATREQDAETPAWFVLLERTARAPADEAPALVHALERALPEDAPLAAGPLIAWLRRAPRPLRGAVARLIARSRPRSSDELLEFLRDPDPEVRRAIARALGSVLGAGEPVRAQDAARERHLEPIRTALLDALADRDPAVARAAAESLGQRCPSAVAARLGTAIAAAAAPLAPQLRALVRCLERAPAEARGSAREQEADAVADEALLARLVSLLDSPSAELAALAARTLGLAWLARGPAHLDQPAPGALRGLIGAYERASPPVRVAILRASVPARADAAGALRLRAEADPDARVAATAHVAAWLAGDAQAAPPGVTREQNTDGLPPLEPASMASLPWPLGPVATFVATDPSRPWTPALQASLCATLAAKEPISRANASAALLRARSPCVAAPLARGPARFGAPGGPAPPVPAAPPSDDELASTPRRGAFQALVLEDGRMLVSALDGAGDASWPDIRHVATENPWRWPYAAE